jgi:hypothetical protein
MRKQHGLSLRLEMTWCESSKPSAISGPHWRSIKEIYKGSRTSKDLEMGFLHKEGPERKFV